MGLVDEVSVETVVALFDVWLLLDALGAGQPQTHEFLRHADAYEGHRRASRQTLRPALPPEVEPLSPSSRDQNRFWEAYGDIGGDTLTAWDRQEPFRLRVGERVRVTPVGSMPTILCDAPEVFLFPAGWSTTLWLRIVGPHKLATLPAWLWMLNLEPLLQLTPGGTEALTLTAVLDTLRDRIATATYGRALGRRARRIIRQRVVAVVNRKEGQLERPYLDEDLLVVYGALEPTPDGMGPVWSMAESSQPVAESAGTVTIRYGRGLFVDLQEKARWSRCHARNLRNLVMMCAVLQSTVKFGSVRLPEDAAAFAALPEAKKSPTRDFMRLVVNGQKTLRQVPRAYRATACRFYWGGHNDIQEAVKQTLPAL